MRWIDAVLFCLSVSYFTFALLHTHVWLQRREACQSISFALVAASIAVLALIETRLLSATSAEEMARWFWWCQFPYWTAFVGAFAFVRPRRAPGRALLGWWGLGLFSLATVANLLVPGGSIYSEIRAVEQFPLLGEPFSVEVGTPSRLLILNQLGALLLLLDVLAAARYQWRAGQRRWAIVMGGSLAVGTGIALVATVLLTWFGIAIPLSTALCMAPLLLAMAAELSQELGLALRLSRELREREAALTTSRERLAMAAAAARAVLWQIDLDSGAFWTGGPGGEISLREGGGRLHHVEYLFANIHAEDRDRVRQFTARMAASGERVSCEFRSITRDGRVVWTYCEGMRTRDRDGPERILAGVALDITDRKRAEAERDRYREELEIATRGGLPTEVAGALAHELNQPLTAIMSNAEAAQRLAGGGRIEELREMVGDIRRATQRAGRLLGRLRRNARRGRSPGRLVSPVGLVKAALDFVQPDLDRAGISVVINGAERPMGLVRVDSLDIEQALINVLQNARDALVSIPAGDRHLEICLQSGADGVDIRIIDNGQGFRGDASRVFDFFFTTKSHGLGMGLSLARAAVEANRGRLTLEAADTRGAVFVLSLPWADAGVVAVRPDRRPGLKLAGVPRAGKGQTVEARRKLAS
jgi:signal transduction histidine kinase